MNRRAAKPKEPTPFTVTQEGLVSFLKPGEVGQGYIVPVGKLWRIEGVDESLHHHVHRAWTQHKHEPPKLKEKASADEWNTSESQSTFHADIPGEAPGLVSLLPEPHGPAHDPTDPFCPCLACQVDQHERHAGQPDHEQPLHPAMQAEYLAHSVVEANPHEDVPPHLAQAEHIGGDHHVVLAGHHGHHFVGQEALGGWHEEGQVEVASIAGMALEEQRDQVNLFVVDDHSEASGRGTSRTEAHRLPGYQHEVDDQDGWAFDRQHLATTQTLSQDEQENVQGNQREQQPISPVHAGQGSNFAPAVSQDSFVYLNGEVAFDKYPWRAARTIAMKMFPEKADYISNTIARNAMPNDIPCAVGEVTQGRPQIWLSTTDRNAVWDAVMRELDARQNRTENGTELAHMDGPGIDGVRAAATRNYTVAHSPRELHAVSGIDTRYAAYVTEAEVRELGENYIDELAEKILGECTDTEIPDEGRARNLELFRDYALLALTKGKETTAEDVHDAWAAWMANIDPEHKSLKPFADLTEEMKAYDEPYVRYIHKHAAIDDWALEDAGDDDELQVPELSPEMQQQVEQQVFNQSLEWAQRWPRTIDLLKREQTAGTHVSFGEYSNAMQQDDPSMHPYDVAGWLKRLGERDWTNVPIKPAAPTEEMANTLWPDTLPWGESEQQYYRTSNAEYSHLTQRAHAVITRVLTTRKLSKRTASTSYGLSIYQANGFLITTADIQALADKALRRLEQREDIARILEKVGQHGDARTLEGEEYQVYAFIVKLQTAHPENNPPALPPETYKMWEWMIGQIKRGTAPQFSANQQHITDILTQATQWMDWCAQYHRPIPDWKRKDFTFRDMEQWVYSMNNKDNDGSLMWKNQHTIYRFDDGWYMAEVSPEDCGREGEIMDHCVGGYGNAIARGESYIVSLRDPEGTPWTTLEMVGTKPEPAVGHDRTGLQWQVMQIQGRHDAKPEDQFRWRIAEWFKHLKDEGLDVRWHDRAVRHDPSEGNEYEEPYYDYDQSHHLEVKTLPDVLKARELIDSEGMQSFGEDTYTDERHYEEGTDPDYGIEGNNPVQLVIPANAITVNTGFGSGNDLDDLLSLWRHFVAQIMDGRINDTDQIEEFVEGFFFIPKTDNGRGQWWNHPLTQYRLDEHGMWALDSWIASAEEAIAQFKPTPRPTRAPEGQDALFNPADFDGRNTGLFERRKKLAEHALSYMEALFHGYEKINQGYLRGPAGTPDPQMIRDRTVQLHDYQNGNRRPNVMVHDMRGEIAPTVTPPRAQWGEYDNPYAVRNNPPMEQPQRFIPNPAAPTHGIRNDKAGPSWQSYLPQSIDEWRKRWQELHWSDWARDHAQDWFKLKSPYKQDVHGLDGQKLTHLPDTLRLGTQFAADPCPQCHEPLGSNEWQCNFCRSIQNNPGNDGYDVGKLTPQQLGMPLNKIDWGNSPLHPLPNDPRWSHATDVWLAEGESATHRLHLGFDVPYGYDDVHPDEQIPPRLYHVAPQSARESILREGLDATGRTTNAGMPGDWSAEHPYMSGEWRPEGVYMFPSYNRAVEYSPQWRADDATWDGMPGTGSDIWEINSALLNGQVIRDPSEAHNWGWDGHENDAYVTEYVPPRALRLVDPGEHLARTAGMTLPQQLRQWEYWPVVLHNAHPDQNPGHTHRVVHEFPDGSSIRQCQTNQDVNAIGLQMRNCWQHRDLGPGSIYDVHGSGAPLHHALFDPYGLPTVAFYHHDRNPAADRIRSPLGHHNQQITPEQNAMLQEYAHRVGAGYEVPPYIDPQTGQPRMQQRVLGIGEDGRPILGSLRLADYNGWTNWDTWNTKLMMDNEQGVYNESRQVIEQGVEQGLDEHELAEKMRDWALHNIIGPENARAMEDAQEWNDIPEDERVDHHYEDLKERSPGAADLVDAFGFGKDVSDSEPTLIDPELVNWLEIVQSIKGDFEENADYERTQEHKQTLTPYDITYWNDEQTKMLDAWLHHHGVDPHAESFGEQRPQSVWGHQTWLPLNLIQEGASEYQWPNGFGESTANEIMQNGGWHENTRNLGEQATHAVQRGTPTPWQLQTMQQALASRGYTPQQIAEIMRQRYRLDPNTNRLEEIGKMDTAPQADPTLDQPGDWTLPEHWTARTANAEMDGVKAYAAVQAARYMKALLAAGDTDYTAVLQKGRTYLWTNHPEWTQEQVFNVAQQAWYSLGTSHREFSADDLDGANYSDVYDWTSPHDEMAQALREKSMQADRGRSVNMDDPRFVRQWPGGGPLNFPNQPYLSTVIDATEDGRAYDSMGVMMPVMSGMYPGKVVNSIPEGAEKPEGSVFYRDVDSVVFVDSIYARTSAAAFELLSYLRERNPGQQIEGMFANPRLQGVAERYNKELGHKPWTDERREQEAQTLMPGLTLDVARQIWNQHYAAVDHQLWDVVMRALHLMAGKYTPAEVTPDALMERIITEVYDAYPPIARPSVQEITQAARFALQMWDHAENEGSIDTQHYVKNKADQTVPPEVEGNLDEWGTPFHNYWGDPRYPGMMRENKTAMAERTGDPQLDALIEEFTNHEMAWLDNDTLPVNVMRSPLEAEGMCGEVTTAFQAFVWDATKGAIHPENVEMTDGSFHAHNPSFEQMGYGDREPGEPGHLVSKIEMPSGTYLIDWTASQYGYKEFPMVQRLDGEQWQREWTASVDPGWRTRIPFFLAPNGAFSMGDVGSEHWQMPDDPAVDSGIQEWFAQEYPQFATEGPDGEVWRDHQGQVNVDPESGRMHVEWPIDWETMQPKSWVTPEMQEAVLAAARERWQASGPATNDNPQMDNSLGSDPRDFTAAAVTEYKKCECNCGCECDGDWHFNEPRCACKSIGCDCVQDAPGKPLAKGSVRAQEGRTAPSSPQNDS